MTDEREGWSCGHLSVFVLFIAAYYFCISFTVCLHSRTVFLNRRAAALYRALASIIPGRERFSWNFKLMVPCIMIQ